MNTHSYQNLLQCRAKKQASSSIRNSAKLKGFSFQRNDLFIRCGLKALKMSVEDVCELGSMLQSEDEEKCLLERKLVELDGAIQTQDRRLNHEVEAEQWAQSEQNNLLERAVNTGNNFEIASSIISQLNHDTLSTLQLSDVLERVQAYVKMRDKLAGDIDSVKNEIKRLEEKSSNLIEIKKFKKLDSVSLAISLGVQRTAKLTELKESIAAIHAEVESLRILQDENVVGRTYILEKLLPQHKDSKTVFEKRTKDFLETSSLQLHEANILLKTLQGENDRITSLIDGLIAERDTIVVKMQSLIFQRKEIESSLASIKGEVEHLRGECSGTSEVEQTMFHDLADAQIKLMEYGKLSRDRYDELERMKRAQAFEQAREEAFLKSQAVNNLGNQQTCREAGRLAVSLELVRDNIAQVTRQIMYEVSTPHKDREPGDDAPHEKLQQLSVLRHSSLERRDAARANYELQSQHVLALRDREQVLVAKVSSKKEQSDSQRSSNETLSANHLDIVERLHLMEEELRQHTASRQLQADIATITADALKLQIEIRNTETELSNALDTHSEMGPSLADHAMHVEAYSAMMNTRFVVTEKDRRLRATRQDKVLQSERTLELLQSELQRADDKFKGAVRVVEDGARAAEEKLVATLNHAIEDGLQMITERDYRAEEIRKLKDDLQIVDAEYAIEMETLGDTMAAESVTLSSSRRISSSNRKTPDMERNDPSSSKGKKRCQIEFEGAHPPPSVKSHQGADERTSKSSSDTRAIGQMKRLIRDRDDADTMMAKRNSILSESGGKPSKGKGSDTSLNADEIDSSKIGEALLGSPALYQNLEYGELSINKDGEILEVQPVEARISGLSQRSRPQDRDQSEHTTYTVSAANKNNKYADAKQRTKKEKSKRSA